ncbi:methyltransferase [Motilibacter sp. E257]|uniref:Methyltransferase n=1 Tax=Motilibacter deserti TaxID=2714956 RepID=A0ABX0H1R3_9ACTN|nr:methyltransferase [Motilibacter deserti]
MSHDDARALRAAFVRAGYTADAVLELLGPAAQAALERNEGVPARRRTSRPEVAGLPLTTLVRLFLLQQPVPETEAAAALPLDAAVAGGLVTLVDGQVRAELDIRPYGADDAPGDGWYVVGDLDSRLDGTAREVRRDHVLGVGGASATLAQITPRDRVGRALDLGTGGGVQALHLTRHADEVVATDVLARALALARLTAGLNQIDLDLREGSLVDPVAGETFDLVVSNPPFVIGAPEVHTYRDAGLPLDTLCRELLAQVPQLLAEGGTFVMIGDWVRLRGEEPHERARRWLPSADGFESLLVVRDEEDPAAYVSTWLRDAGEQGAADATDRYDRWLAGLEDAGVEAVEFGWFVVRRRGSGPARSEVLDWPHPVEQPAAWWLSARVEANAWLTAHDDEALLSARLRVREDVVQEQHGEPGAEEPETIVLRQQRGQRAATSVSTEAAALVGASDGTLQVGQLVDAVAQVLEQDTGELRGPLLGELRELVRCGTLEPA